MKDCIRRVSRAHCGLRKRRKRSCDGRHARNSEAGKCVVCSGWTRGLDDDGAAHIGEGGCQAERRRPPDDHRFTGAGARRVGRRRGVMLGLGTPRGLLGNQLLDGSDRRSEKKIRALTRRASRS
jgi:hypothetical protein